MAKKLFNRLSDAVKKRANGNPRVVEADEHGIDSSEVSKSARHVVEVLVEGGYEAYSLPMLEYNYDGLGIGSADWDWTIGGSATVTPYSFRFEVNLQSMANYFSGNR